VKTTPAPASGQPADSAAATLTGLNPHHDCRHHLIGRSLYCQFRQPRTGTGDSGFGCAPCLAAARLAAFLSALERYRYSWSLSLLNGAAAGYSYGQPTCNQVEGATRPSWGHAGGGVDRYRTLGLARCLRLRPW